MTTVGGGCFAVDMAHSIDFIAHIRHESLRFGEVMRTASAEARVPTCPDWNSDDLLWHLGGVQWFWAYIVRHQVTDPSSIEGPGRPESRQDLLAFFESASAALQATLRETAPEESRWTWSRDQTAGFIRRRQAHEALIHRVDAELTADVDRSPMDPTLCSDGVDEALRVMYGGAPDWGSVEADTGSTLRIRTTDTSDSWWVTLARFTGTDPQGTSYDEPSLIVAEADPDDESAATVSGTAADLDCWLWGRPTSGRLERSGDQGTHDRLQSILDQGLQ